MTLATIKISEDERNKLSNLAMAVEVHDDKQYSVYRDIYQLAELLNHAGKSKHPLVMRALRQFAEIMDDDTAKFLKVLGTDIDSIRLKYLLERKKVANKNERRFGFRSLIGA